MKRLYRSRLRCQAKHGALAKQELVPHAVLREWNILGPHLRIQPVESPLAHPRIPQRVPIGTETRPPQVQPALKGGKPVDPMEQSDQPRRQPVQDRRIINRRTGVRHLTELHSRLCPPLCPASMTGPRTEFPPG